jgi:hypothetical protein
VSRLTSPIVTQALRPQNTHNTHTLHHHSFHTLTCVHKHCGICAPSLDAQSTHTSSGTHNTMECAHLFFDNKPHALHRCAQNQNLVPMAHQPICTLHLHLFPMTHQPIWIITSHTTQVRAKPKWLTNLYAQLQMGFRIRDITFPSPLFMHCPQCIIYTYTYKTSKKFQKDEDTLLA